MGDELRTIPYFGGKYSHLEWLLEHLPYRERYIEPFGGSGAVLANRPPAMVETYNDLDESVVTFFQTLREQPDALADRIRNTPYSREEFKLACEQPAPESDLEQARRFFVRISMGFNSKTSATTSDWSYSVGNTRNSRSKQCNQFVGYPETLPDVANRFKRVQIENRPASKVIETHDHPDALVYCDPPYDPDGRRNGSYAVEMSKDEHRELAAQLHECEAAVAVSGYDSELYADLYADWYRWTGEEETLPSSGQQSTDQEVLWTNYDAEAEPGATQGLTLEDFQAQAGEDNG